MASSNGKPSPGISLVIGALVVGVATGYFIGRAGGGGGGATTTTPVATGPGASETPPPVKAGQPTPTFTPTPPPPTGYASGSACKGPDTKTLWVYPDGSNSCKNYDGPVEVWPGLKGTINWNSPPGTSLHIVFPTSKAFDGLYCGGNFCTINQANSAYSGTPQEYAAYVYGSGTPTPKPGSMTPTPAGIQLGRIIIKP